jgi:hypothetical protein
LSARGGFFGGHIGVDLGVRNLDLAVDLVLAQALLMMLSRISSRKCANGCLPLHLVAQLLHAHFLVLGDAGDRAVEHDVVDADAHSLGQLLLRAFDDHRAPPPACAAGRRVGLHALLRLHALLGWRWRVRRVRWR